MKAKALKRNMLAKLLLTVAGLASISFTALAQDVDTNSAKVDTTNAGFIVRVAPGELLPISVKLSNFGGGKKIDVLVKYGIYTVAGKLINEVDETLAVETTADRVKTVQIPFNIESGTYIAKTSVLYENQLIPATSQFSFTVERKVFGFFISDLLFYGSILIVACILMFVLGHALIRRSRTLRLVPLDYSDISSDQRTFYEIISDTIMEMREKIGDDALDIASNINGLKINKETGRVLGLTGKPSKIIDDLIAKYEKDLGQKPNFTQKRKK